MAVYLSVQIPRPHSTFRVAKGNLSACYLIYLHHSLFDRAPASTSTCSRPVTVEVRSTAAEHSTNGEPPNQHMYLPFRAETSALE